MTDVQGTSIVFAKREVECFNPNSRIIATTVGGWKELCTTKSNLNIIWSRCEDGLVREGNFDCLSAFLLVEL